MKQSEHTRVYRACVLILLLIFAVFTARLIDWQLLHGDAYRAIAMQEAGYRVGTEAVRGEILDRDGKGLVVNTTHRRIVLEKPLLPREHLDSLLAALIALTEQSGDKWADTLPVEERDGKFIFRDGDRESLPEPENAAACIAALQARYHIADDLTPRELRNVISVRFGMEQESASRYIFAPDVSVACMSAVSERTQGVTGVAVETYRVRAAAQPTLAPHLLGATGAISAEEYEALADEGYRLTDSIGKFGVEAAWESALRGTAGSKTLLRTDGETPDTVEQVNARPGGTVWLTIRSSLQAATVKALAENIRAANAAGAKDCTSGAAVLLNVSDFSVLAAASAPTYDLNRYSAYGDDYVALAADERAPLFDRAFSGSFACGSVFKPCVALAALQEGVVTPSEEIVCTRYYDYYPDNPVACMHYHGAQSLDAAMAHSCNYYFAEVGRRLGIKRISAYAAALGLGEPTGLETEESRGVLAGRDSTGWTAGNTVQAAIGQSDNAFTPVQLAAYTATLANGGKRLNVHVTEKITDYSRENILWQAAPRVLSEVTVSGKALAAVQEAMRLTAHSPEGTAYRVFGDFSPQIAAKTGTAENAGSDHAAFICYAPFDRPQVALAVILEHGADTLYAMRTARAMLQAYFA
ncbi:MAG: hypothetical protein IJ598_02320 [Ruminococcus sp.]|nr:hypothetical protein [Ruminococcus sp.]